MWPAPHSALSVLSTHAPQTPALQTWPLLQAGEQAALATQTPPWQTLPAPQSASSVLSTQAPHVPALQTWPLVQAGLHTETQVPNWHTSPVLQVTPAQALSTQVPPWQTWSASQAGVQVTLATHLPAVHFCAEVQAVSQVPQCALSESSRKQELPHIIPASQDAAGGLVLPQPEAMSTAARHAPAKELKARANIGTSGSGCVRMILGGPGTGSQGVACAEAWRSRSRSPRRRPRRARR